MEAKKSVKGGMIKVEGRRTKRVSDRGGAWISEPNSASSARFISTATSEANLTPVLEAPASEEQRPDSPENTSQSS